MGSVMDSTFGSFKPTATDSNGGLSGGQMFARKAVAGALQGISGGLQPNAAGARPVDFSKLGSNSRPRPQNPAPSTTNSTLPYQDNGAY